MTNNTTASVLTGYMGKSSSSDDKHRNLVIRTARTTDLIAIIDGGLTDGRIRKAVMADLERRGDNCDEAVLAWLDR